MNKRVLYLVLLLTISLQACIKTDAGQQPNILIILADDLGYADVGFHGSDINTPNIDRLAKNGVQLEQFYSAPMCSPTRAGLMTGRYPIRFGLMRAVIPPHREFGMPAEEFTIAEMLAEAGYNHRGIVGKWHLGHRQQKWLPANQGFTYFEGCHNGAVDYFTQVRDGERDWQELYHQSDKEGYTTDLIGNASIEFINTVPLEEPFFLYIPFTAPHSPFQAKEEDLAKYPHRKGKKQTYAAMVKCMDENIGRIVQIIEDRGQLNNTFILFFSDNGGVNNIADNAPHRGSKLTVYQGGIHVVAAVQWPNGHLSGGKIVNERMGYIDIFPTLMEIAGYKDVPDNELDGISVLAAMRGGRLPDRPWFTYLDQNADKVEHFALNSNDWKVIWRRNAPDNDSIISEVELFDIKRDSIESINLVEANQKVIQALQSEIENFYEFKAEIQNPRYFDKRIMSGPILTNWQPTN